jgi:CheY-like chemotaxis protein
MIVKNTLQRIPQVGEIDQATNGQEAFDVVKSLETNSDQKQIDIIFLDLNMPILNGYEACTKILNFYQTLFLDKTNKKIGLSSAGLPKKTENWLAEFTEVFQNFNAEDETSC